MSPHRTKRGRSAPGTGPGGLETMTGSWAAPVSEAVMLCSAGELQVLGVGWPEAWRFVQGRRLDVLAWGFDWVLGRLSHARLQSVRVVDVMMDMFVAQ